MLTHIKTVQYFRDKNQGLDIEIPYNYFPENDSSKEPVFSWRCHANLMFSNWLNYFVYQTTPYDISEIKLDGDVPAIGDED